MSRQGSISRDKYANSRMIVKAYARRNFILRPTFQLSPISSALQLSGQACPSNS